MSLTQEQLKSRLLAILASPSGSGGEMTDDLDAGDWQALLDIAQMHRLSSLLHRQLTSQDGAGCPAGMLQALADQRRQHALRALHMQHELLHVHRVLTAAGIRHVALKGAFLAWHAYPKPDLRPIRDLDILVAPEDALRAYDLLLANGHKRIPDYPGSPEACLRRNSKHLPPIQRSQGIVLELHARLFSYARGAHSASHELSHLPGFWDRLIARPLAGEMISYPSATDQLLHLLVHAISDHRLNNGPLVLTDIHYLIASNDIDWPLFWQLAERTGQRAAALLGLHLTQFQLGKLQVQWPDHEPPGPALLQALCSLSLQDLDRHKDVYLRKDLTSGWPRFFQWLRKQLLPSRSELAVQFPVRHLPWTLPYWYVRKWLAGISRLLGLLRNRQQMAARQADLQALHQLDGWLLARKTPSPHESLSS